jgi:hypothetical protein
MDLMFSHDNFLSPAALRNRFTLIIGEVNTGKTTITRNILDAFCALENEKIAVVDLAPHALPSDPRGGSRGVGGRIRTPGGDHIRYLHGYVHAPRLEGKDESEAVALAEQNVKIIESLFEQALKEKPDSLFVNDCSLYLHAGEPEKMLKWLRSVKTSVVNGYHGDSLGGGILSERESAGMELLIQECDRVIRLTQKRQPS